MIVSLIQILDMVDNDSLKVEFTQFFSFHLGNDSPKSRWQTIV